MSDGVRRLDHYRERVEVDTSGVAGVGRRGRAPVYVVCRERRRAADWAYRNKPDRELKLCHPDSLLPMLGLHLQDEAVYVLDAPSQEARDRWAVTGAKLVWL